MKLQQINLIMEKEYDMILYFSFSRRIYNDNN